MKIFHKILTDAQYRFCELYCFGIDFINEMALYMNRAYSEYIDPIPINPNIKILHYRNISQALEYQYHNATGSYYKAFYHSTYKTAKANSMRLLKNPDIKKEIEYMELAIKIIGDIDEAQRRYISPNAKNYSPEDKNKKIEFWTYLRDLGYKKYGVNIF